MHQTLISFARQFAVMGVAFGAAVVFAAVAAAWTGPAGSPPNNNVAAPINVSDVAQVKAGGIGATNVVADMFCLGTDCITSWGGGGSGGGGAPELLWSGFVNSGDHALIAGKKFSDYTWLTFLGGNACPPGSRTDTTTLPRALFVSKSDFNFGNETFSGDDSGFAGARYVDDTHFNVWTSRKGDLCEIWGFK